MPKTTMNEDDLASADANNIWFSRQIGTHKGETISEPMDNRSYNPFRPGIARVNRCHNLASDGFTHSIHVRPLIRLSVYVVTYYNTL